MNVSIDVVLGHGLCDSFRPFDVHVFKIKVPESKVSRAHCLTRFAHLVG